jgi:hypothetical protein
MYTQIFSKCSSPTEHQSILIDAYHRILKAALYPGRSVLRPTSIKPLAEAEASALMQFIKNPNATQARQRGAQLCLAGVGFEAILDLGQAARRLCCQRWPKSTLPDTLATIDAYYWHVESGFQHQYTISVLEDQERIRSALEKALGTCLASKVEFC